MRSTFLSVLLMLALMAGVAQAQAFTLKLDDDFASTDISLDRIGGFEVLFVVSADYEMERSSLTDLDLDIQDYYIGPMAKWHFTPEDNPIDVYVGIAPMVRNVFSESVDWDEIPIVYEAGVSIFATEHVGVGLAYQYCAEFENDDRFMVTIPVRF